jgi:hypothetical protein
MGWLRKGTDSYTGGLLVLATSLTLCAILVLSLRLSRPKDHPGFALEGATLPIK